MVGTVKNSDIVILKPYYCSFMLTFLLCEVCNKFFFRDSFGFLLSSLVLFFWSYLKLETMDVDVFYNLCRIKNRYICILKYNFWTIRVKESCNRKFSMISRFFGMFNFSVSFGVLVLVYTVSSTLIFSRLNFDDTRVTNPGLLFFHLLNVHVYPLHSSFYR